MGWEDQLFNLPLSCTQVKVADREWTLMSLIWSNGKYFTFISTIWDLWLVLKPYFDYKPIYQPIIIKNSFTRIVMSTRRPQTEYTFIIL